MAYYKPQKNIPLPYTERHFPVERRNKRAIWPNGARMAFIGYVALEQWDWNQPRTFSLTGRPPYNPNPILGHPPLDVRTQVKYGAEVGMPRIRDILQEVAVPFTMLTCGSYAEDFPRIVKELSDLGYEINAHTYSYSVAATDLSLAEHREDIQRTYRILEDVTGKRPTGWLSPSAQCDINTIAACVEEGVLYNADLQDDELPYFLDLNGKSIVIVPYRMIGNINDYLLLKPQNMTLSDSLEFMKQSFDRCYEAAGTTPLLFNFGTHPFVIGRADAAQIFREFLRYVKSRSGVWMTTLEGVANWWNEAYRNGYGVAG
jgi:peptidoglycan/xylan/chitin deacetylase (PgdA/CDA1 family)